MDHDRRCETLLCRTKFHDATLGATGQPSNGVFYLRLLRASPTSLWGRLALKFSSRTTSAYVTTNNQRDQCGLCLHWYFCLERGSVHRLCVAFPFSPISFSGTKQTGFGLRGDLCGQ